MDETGKGKAASEKAPKRRHGAWWVEILIATAVVLVVVGIAIPAYSIKKTNARRTEAKAKLVEIYKAVESYATDNDGYPEYLLGGSASVNDEAARNPTLASDPLLKQGYLIEYPRNPFAVPHVVKAAQEQYSDPFRPGTEQSRFGVRFGEDYCLMGQVLADFRYAKLPNQEMVKRFGISCFSDTEYPFYDIWPAGAHKPKQFLPGEFFYKTIGRAVIDSKDKLRMKRPWVPVSVNAYILGLYGAPNDRGTDVLGPEPDISLNETIFNLGESITSPVWTRSTMTKDSNYGYLGSWYLFPVELGYTATIVNHFPDGIPDAVIFCRQSATTYK